MRPPSRFLTPATRAACLAVLGLACNRPPASPPPAPICKPVTPAPRPAETTPEGPRPIARRVIIVSEDGLRPDAIPLARAPTHDRLMKEGAWSLRARTIRQASTLPAHAAMLSGFDVVEHGLYWNSWRPERGFIKVPTIFTAAGGAGAAAFVGKQKLAHIARPAVDVFERPGFFCKKVAEQAAAYFVQKRPRIEFVHFADPDESGHSKGWMSEAQLEAVRNTDRCLATLVNAVEASGVAHETLMIISSDHGGRGKNHSGNHQEDRWIPWLVWGAGVRKGHRIREPVSTFDTTATALWALGEPPPPGLLGRPVKEAFLAASDE